MTQAHYKLLSTVSLLCLTALSNAGVAAQEVQAVTAKRISELTVRLDHRAPAEVLSLNRSAVSAETEGVVLEVFANAGQVVLPGAVLITLDRTDLELVRKRIEAAIRSTEARIEQAKLRLERARNLSEGRFVSADELLARETELSVLEAELQRQRLELVSAERDIEKTVIAAPFRGVVQERQAQLGAYMRRGDPVVTLVDIERFELEARVADHLARNFDTASEASFVSDGITWPVQLTRRFPLLEQGERVVRMRFRFLERAPMIGTSGELRWRSAEQLIPAELLVRREGRLGVFVAEDAVARFMVLPDAVEGRPARYDLPDHNRLVTDGRQRLRDGDRIRLIER